MPLIFTKKLFGFLSGRWNKLAKNPSKVDFPDAQCMAYLTYIWVVLGVNVGKHTSPMDPMDFSGFDLELIPLLETKAQLSSVKIFARLSPFQKEQIIQVQNVNG